MDKLLTRTLCEAGAAAGQLTDCGINPAEDAQDSTCQNAPPHSPHSGPRWFEWESFGCILANAEERGETADYYFLREGKGKGDEAPSDDWDMVSTSQQHFPTPPGAIFTVQFDDDTRELSLVKRTEIPKDQPISWMTFDHARKNIYGAGMKQWGSYTVQSPREIQHATSIPMGGHPRARDADTKTRAIFVLAAKKAPHLVYGNPFYDHAGFINVHSVNPSGELEKNVQNAELDEKSAVHGMVFDKDEEYLYSADMWANKIWCHRKDKQTGLLTLIDSITAPSPNDHPRWVEIHPTGPHLYVLMEAGNRLLDYTLDPTTHLPIPDSARSYPLIPPGMDTFHPKMYRSDVVFTSSSGNYLFATARSNSPSLTGYISAFKLGPGGEIDGQICMNPTPTSGGHSNAVSPCPWSDEWLALCDDEQGWVEMYRWHDEFLARVAHLDVKEPGFGMNAIWYD